MGAQSSTTMQKAATACKGCKNLGNKELDTVKLDMEKFKDSESAMRNKENTDPGQMRESPGTQKNPREEEQEQERLAKEADQEALRRAEQERNLEERQRQLQKELQEVRRQQEEEAARLAREEARRVELAREAEEEARLRGIQEEEEARLKREEEEERERRRLKEEEEETRNKKKEELRAFLEKAGFKEVSEKKKVKKGVMMSSGFLYPLHAAVDLKDPEAVDLLLWAGADPSFRDSQNRTPLKLAETKNKQGSHDQVIAALAAA